MLCVALLQPLASTINTFASAMHKFFLASSDEAKAEIRAACFDYLCLGGVCSSGMLALVSGLNPRPLSLVLHFFAMTVYAFARLMLPFPSIKSFSLFARMTLVSGFFPSSKSELLLLCIISLNNLIFDVCRLAQSGVGIIFPIIKAEGVRQMFFPRTIAAIYRSPPA